MGHCSLLASTSGNSTACVDTKQEAFAPPLPPLSHMHAIRVEPGREISMPNTKQLDFFLLITPIMAPSLREN